MAATIQQIIGKTNPKLYAKNGVELLKEYGSIEKIPAEKVEPKPLSEHTIVYDSPSETLEPIYFFIIDLLEDFGLKTEKLVDNFSSSPGSGHFSELGTKASVMQQQATKTMADINTLLRSVLNIIYDLKEFRTRLQHYEDLKSGDKEAARLSLKQIWLDKVDMTKGNSSVKAMAFAQGGAGRTLIDAFLIANSTDDVNKIDLNDVVKRILIPRVAEFNTWINQSEKELRKRYEIERTYLKSQVSSLKLYSRWAKPYLKAATDLEMKDVGRDPAMVKTFNTILLELSLLGKRKIDVKTSALEGKLPDDFQKLKTRRNYHTCVLVDFKFRGIPTKTNQQQGQYVFGGKAEMTFKSYALNDDELNLINKELEKSDIGETLQLIEGTTTETMDQLQEEIDFFLNEKDDEETKKKEKSGDNPFLALIGYYDKVEKVEKKSSKTKEEEKPIIPDNWAEKTHIRTLAEEDAIDTSFTLFDIYKKAHGMESFS